MPKALAQTTIARSADDVWAVVGEFADMTWQESVETCTPVGDLRVAKMAGFDLEVDELLVHQDEAQRTYTYAVTAMRGITDFDRGDGTVLDLADMIGHHRATVTVIPLDEGACRVDYALELDEGHDSNLASTIGQYQSVIDDLKRQLEG
jgi:hypothetical protein